MCIITYVVCCNCHITLAQYCQPCVFGRDPASPNITRGIYDRQGFSLSGCRIWRLIDAASLYRCPVWRQQCRPPTDLRFDDGPLQGAARRTLALGYAFQSGDVPEESGGSGGDGDDIGNVERSGGDVLRRLFLDSDDSSSGEEEGEEDSEEEEGEGEGRKEQEEEGKGLSGIEGGAGGETILEDDSPEAELTKEIEVNSEQKRLQPETLGRANEQIIGGGNVGLGLEANLSLGNKQIKRNSNREF